MASLKHSKTTQGLLTQLATLKEKKQNISEKIKQNIYKNNEILDEKITANNKFNQKLIVNRERSLQLLEKRLKHKLSSDKRSDQILDSAVQQIQSKRTEIQRRIEQINNRNLMRMEELKELEQKFIHKYNEDLKKNEMRQKSLKEQYKRLKKEGEKIHETNIEQKKEARQQWHILREQKWRLQEYVRENQERQAKLVEKRNPIPVRKEEPKRKQEKYIPTEKQYNKLKPPENVDSKLMGNQYLQQIKLIHKEHLVNKKKKKLMNLNLKIINYNPEIMDRILRSTSDLSKIPKIAVSVEKKEPEVQVKIEAKSEVKSQHHRSNGQFLLKEDQQTQRYLMKIKSNLKQLQKIKKQEKQTTFSKNNPENQSIHEANLIMPTTFQTSSREI